MAINSLFKERHKKIHMVGIGGIGMSGIARILMQSGFMVSGSDLVKSPEVQNLQSLGAQIFLGHDSNNVGDADVVVYSSAVAKDNPEIIAAQTKNVPLISRALMLAEIMRLRCGIAIVGSHGKTTTTSLIGTLMHEKGLDPTVIIGGIVNHFGTNARLGSSQFMVTEADESDGTFLHLSPTIAVVTNIDAEHLDYYPGGINEISHKVVGFLNNLPFYGLAVVCSDDPPIKAMLPQINRRVITYGLSDDATYQAKHITAQQFHTSFDLIKQGDFIARIQLAMVGEHNVLNTLAAIAVLEEIGIGAENLIETLGRFNGVKRRFSPIAHTKNYLVIDDYAHHPTEIKSVLHAARAAFPGRTIRVLFQPHRYSRTRDLMLEFAHAFEQCDSLAITDIYSAGEAPLDGVSTPHLIGAIRAETGRTAHYAKTPDDGSEHIVSLVEPHDIIFTLGAGSITHAAPKIAQLLEDKFGS